MILKPSSTFTYLENYAEFLILTTNVIIQKLECVSSSSKFVPKCPLHFTISETVTLSTCKYNHRLKVRMTKAIKENWRPNVNLTDWLQFQMKCRKGLEYPHILERFKCHFWDDGIRGLPNDRHQGWGLNYPNHLKKNCEVDRVGGQKLNTVSSRVYMLSWRLSSWIWEERFIWALQSLLRHY